MADDDEAVLAALRRAEQNDRKPTSQCEFCGRFYSERTAKDHAHCIQAYDRECFERAFPYG